MVVGTYNINELEKARELASKIASNSPDYKPQIYKNDKYSAVVIGENMSLAQARARKEKANQAGIPHLWTSLLDNPWDAQ